MKKTLVALAVLAASGASFAQVGLSGEFAYGYSATTDGAGLKTSGGGLNTAQLVFSAKEDLGGGNSVAVTMKTDGSSGRSASLNNDDQIIELQSRFATFKAGSWKPGNWLAGNTGYAPWEGLDGKVLSAGSTRDSMGLSVPIGPVKLSATLYEPAGLLGEGSGNAGPKSGQQNTTLNAAYGTGGLSLAAAYVMYSNPDATDSTSKSQYRFAGKYDFGVAQIGAGITVLSYGMEAKRTENLISVSTAPFGALSLSFGYAMNKLDVPETKSTLYGTKGDLSGFMLEAKYNLSKRTYTVADYGSWKQAVNDKDNSNVMALRLVHDF